jgi:hypothetical protein
MKTQFQIFLALIFISACQSKPTQTDFVPGGAEQGFLPPPVWNASMQNLKQDMISIQHFIFDQAEFEKPENQAFLKKQIHQLAETSKNIKHDPVVYTKDPTVRFVATQFADELQRADENFKAGWSDYSRWQLVKVTSYCLECHTRMKDGPSFNPENSTRSYFTQLPIASRIEFMMAFRQFEPAFKLVLENLKENKSEQKVDVKSDRIAHLGLLIAVQYMQDPEKANQLVTAIDRNSSLPEYLKKANRTWKKSLAQWNPNKLLNNLPDVKAVYAHRLSEVDDMIAVPALLRILTSPLNREELGETLFMTGQAYENLHRFSYISLHENYYESCVRQASHTKWGLICYKKLSDSIAEGYSGSAGVKIPVEMKQRLESLKKVVEESK